MRICATFSRTLLSCAVLAFALVAWAAPLAAQAPAPAKPADAPAAAKPAPEKKDAEKKDADKEEKDNSVVELAKKQSDLADKFKRLQGLMVRMAEFEKSSNPRRAALLKEAYAEADRNHINLQMETLVKLLTSEQYARAVGNQGDVKDDMTALLNMLLKEQRDQRLKSEQERYKEYIKEVTRLINKQRALESQNRNEDDPDQVAKKQGELGKETKGLATKIKQNEEGGDQKPGDPNGEKKPNDGMGKPMDGMNPMDGMGKPMDGMGKPMDGMGKPMDGMGKPMDGMGKPMDGMGKPMDGMGKPMDGMGKPMDGMGKPMDGMGKPMDGMGKPMDGMGKPMDGMGKPMDGMGKPMDGMGKPMDGMGMPMDGMGKPMPGMPGMGMGKPKPSDGDSDSEGGDPPPMQQNPNDNPARKRIEAAEKKMEQAKQKLEKAKRAESAKDQEDARNELEQAKQELERILRQLREEEIEHVLAMLEGRFKAMLEAQIKIYEETLRLGRIPVARRTPETVDVQAGKLSFDEKKIVIEAQKALTLLREEGSSIAFPETVESMIGDMVQVSERLARSKVDTITSDVELEIIRTLEQMIEALQKAQRDAEARKMDPPPPSEGQPPEEPLVDKIAELKMIKELQVRVNARTTRYAKLLEDENDEFGQATEGELVEALKKLAALEQKIYKITRDVVLGKNE